MTNNIASSSLTMAIAQVLRRTGPADREQHALTGAGRRAGPTRTPPAHGCLAARRRGTHVPTALEGCPGLARVG